MAAQNRHQVLDKNLSTTATTVKRVINKGYVLHVQGICRKHLI